ncbi:MAG: GntR family transcriptional regulator [Candidatus Bipolaricaulota bacterium]|nr:FadR family transcriptional regulator [Candidatus Bipolaricaulota bacterium]
MTDYLDNIKVERESISRKIIRRILKHIKKVGLKPGDKLPSEKELMEKMGVGRSSIREALHALVTVDILETKPGKGYYVKRKSNIFCLPGGSELAEVLIEEQDFMALIEVRKFLEKKTVVLACRRATEDDIEKVKRIMDEIREAGEQDENISDVTVKLHLALAQSTKNQIMVQLMEQIIPLIVTKARLMELPPEEDVEIHDGVARALENRDEKELKGWVDEHLDYLKERFIVHMESQKSDESTE